MTSSNRDVVKDEEEDEDNDEDEEIVDEEAVEKEKKEKKAIAQSMRVAVVTNIFHEYVSVIKYSSDTEEHSWCEVRLSLLPFIFYHSIE